MLVQPRRVHKCIASCTSSYVPGNTAVHVKRTRMAGAPTGTAVHRIIPGESSYPVLIPTAKHVEMLSPDANKP